METPDETQDHITRVDIMVELPQSLPSVPEIAASLEQLTQALAMLTARVEAVEQACEALRQHELSRLWELDANEE
jgi:hypothetical protein